jgi:hypothetical protein
MSDQTAKRTTEKQKEYSARKALNLTDSYVANLMGVSVKDIREQCPEAFELKRLTVQLKRAIKEKAR